MTATVEVAPVQGEHDEAVLLGWAVVANVRATTSQGEQAEQKRGTRHFSPGTKVWVMPPQWGDGGAAVMVLGRHRGRPGGLARMVMPSRHLENFRVKGVYENAVANEMRRPWRATEPRQWQSQEEAEEMARHWLAAARE